MASRRTRRAVKNSLKNIEVEVNALLEDYDETKRVTLTGVTKLLSEKTKRFVEISEELGEQIQDDDEYDKFAEESFQEEIKYKQLINELEQKVALTTKSSENKKQEAPDSKFKTVTLPKIQIKKFAGDYTEWQSFEQSFEEAVHKNISNVERMNYLFSLLEGEAFQCVRGLNLSNENYTSARELLSKRFGDKKSLISAHMDRLLNLETVRNEKTRKS